MLGVQKPCGAESDLTGLQSVDFDILPKGFGRGEGHARVLCRLHDLKLKSYDRDVMGRLPLPQADCLVKVCSF